MTEFKWLKPVLSIYNFIIQKMMSSRKSEEGVFQIVRRAEAVIR